MGDNTQNMAGTPSVAPAAVCRFLRRLRTCHSRGMGSPMITLEPAPKMLRESGSYFRPSSEGTADIQHGMAFGPCQASSANVRDA